MVQITKPKSTKTLSVCIEIHCYIGSINNNIYVVVIIIIIIILKLFCFPAVLCSHLAPDIIAMCSPQARCALQLSPINIPCSPWQTEPCYAQGQLAGAKQQLHFGWTVLKWKLLEAFPCFPLQQVFFGGRKRREQAPCSSGSRKPQHLLTYMQKRHPSSQLLSTGWAKPPCLL